MNRGSAAAVYDRRILISEGLAAASPGGAKARLSAVVRRSQIAATDN